MIYLKTFLLVWVTLVSGYLSADSTYYAGYKQIFVEDDRFDKFPLAIWFPTQQSSKLEKFGPFTLKVSLGAKIAAGKFPLVIISHGSGGSPFVHRDMAKYLAEHGYIVAALQHPRNNYLNNVDEATTTNWRNRPKHVSAALDKVLRTKWLTEHINSSKIGIIGHSAGGFTALALLGGIPDTKHSRLHCQNKRHLDQGFCDFGKEKEELHQDFKIQGLADKRFRSAVLLAPVGVLFSGTDNLNKVNAPLLIYRAEYDRQLNYPFHAELISRALPRQDKLVYRVLKNANHFSFISPFPESIADEIGLPARDEPGFNRQESHHKMNIDILNFLNQTL